MIQFNQPNNKAKKIIQKKTIDMTSGLGLKSSNVANKNIRYGTSIAVQATPHSVKSLPNMHMAQSIGAEGVTMSAPSFYSPLHTAQNWQNPSKKREIYQYCRFYYSIQPKVAAAIDFYSQFSLHSGYTLKCKSKKMITYYNHICQKLKIKNVCKKILFQYFLIGDVYPFKTIECKHCGGSGFLADGSKCNHPGGSFKNIILLNPDCIQVQKDAFTHEKTISMIPDDELKMKVSKKHLYPNINKIDPKFLKLIASGQPILLSNTSVSHIMHGQKDYATYGQPIMKRLFMILNYKQKLMSANWVIAQRLILPLRLVKVGTQARPATSQQLADITSQLTQTANDPNLTLVTHHAVEYDWIGATGKIQAINTQFEMIGKEILDGMMLSQALLNGEGPSASGVQAGLQCMIARLQSARDELREWIEQQVFKPIAQMNGFIDQQATKQLQSVTNNKKDIVYLYPKFVWNDLNLRDDSQQRQLDLQLFDKQIISRQQLLRGFEYDYDQMTQQMRQQAVITAQTGQLMGGQQGGNGSGMGGMGGDIGGGMGGGDIGSAPPSQGDMGQPPMGGMEMSGGGQQSPMGNDMAPTPATANSSSTIKIGKRGDKKPQVSQPQPIQTKNVQLTGLQQKTLRAIKALNIPYQLFLQYKVSVPGNKYPYVMDFAWPKVGVSIQADGAKWHSDQQAKIKNAQRDQKLANIGWTVLRFKQDAINDKITQVQKIIYNNIVQASKRHQQQKKKASFDSGLNKIASKLYNSQLININNFNQQDLQYQLINMPNDLGTIINIGIKQ